MAIDLDNLKSHREQSPSGGLDANQADKLIAEVEMLRGQLVYSFNETSDGAPEYTQGSEKLHELHELVTAEECNGLVKTIKAARGHRI